MEQQQLFKVLLDGKSFHGGSMKWELPKKEGRKWIPSKWHEHKNGSLAMCQSGLHLTSNPVVWWKPGCKFYLAEADGVGGQREDKIVASRVRLLRELPVPDYLQRTEEFISSIKDVKFFHPENPPLKSWQFFEGKT